MQMLLSPVLLKERWKSMVEFYSKEPLSMLQKG